MSLIPNCAEKEGVRVSECSGGRERQEERSVWGGSDWDLGLGEWILVRGGS